MIDKIESTNMFTDSLYNNNKIISRQIADESLYGREQEDFISAVISEFENSIFLKNMAVAQRYYDNENDVLQDKRMVIGKDPETGLPVKMESQVLANNKLAHNFMKKLTRQKSGRLHAGGGL